MAPRRSRTPEDEDAGGVEHGTISGTHLRNNRRRPPPPGALNLPWTTPPNVQTAIGPTRTVTVPLHSPSVTNVKGRGTLLDAAPNATLHPHPNNRGTGPWTPPVGFGELQETRGTAGTHNGKYRTSQCTYAL